MSIVKRSPFARPVAVSLSGLLAMPLLMTGCATAVRGTNETLSITTAPAGAQVTARTEKNGEIFQCAPTPCEIEMARTARAVVTIEKAGFQPIRYRVASSVTTSNDVVRPGTLIAGLPPGSYVLVGKPAPGSQIGLRGASLAAALPTLGAATLIDAASSANRNLVPQAVTVILAPLSRRDDAIADGDPPGDITGERE